MYLLLALKSTFWLALTRPIIAAVIATKADHSSMTTHVKRQGNVCMGCMGQTPAVAEGQTTVIENIHQELVDFAQQRPDGWFYRNGQPFSQDPPQLLEWPALPLEVNHISGNIGSFQLLTTRRLEAPLFLGRGIFNAHLQITVSQAMHMALEHEMSGHRHVIGIQIIWWLESVPAPGSREEPVCLLPQFDEDGAPDYTRQGRGYFSWTAPTANDGTHGLGIVNQSPTYHYATRTVNQEGRHSIRFHYKVTFLR